MTSRQSVLRTTAERAVRGLFTAPALSRAQALDRMERISAVTHLVISTEHLCRPESRSYGGFNNWDVTRDSLRRSGPRTRALLDVVARRRVTDALHLTRVAGSLVLLAPGRHDRARAVCDGLVAGSALLLYPRSHYGTDGSDQVSFLVQSASALARVSGRRSGLVDACLWAVSAQSTLSYAASGWVKLAGASWRQGLALEGVTRTLTYGDPHVWRAVKRFPKTAKVLGTGVLALECTFPLVYVAGGRLARSYVLGASVFHVANGRIMGLGRFIPAFLSMHPALLWTTQPRAATGHGEPVRDDTMVRTMALGAAGLAVTAAATTWWNTRTVRRGRGDEQFLTTAEGNRLALRTWGAGLPGEPVYVFENGMASTSEHWERIADDLAQTSTVVTYDRAGYARSTCRPGTATDLEDLQRDACAVVEHVAGDRPVVLVGHSLGGYLALEVAAATRADVLGVALVDSTHPDELRLSEKQKHGQKRLTDVFPLMSRSLDLGLGMLLAPPDFVHRLPERARATALAQYRTGRLWHAARREWAAAQRVFEREQGLPALRVPVLSLSAQHTVEDDEVQGDLHRAIVAAAPWGECDVVTGADHDSILTGERQADEVAGRLRAFAARCLSARAARQAGVRTSRTPARTAVPA